MKAVGSIKAHLQAGSCIVGLSLPLFVSWLALVAQLPRAGALSKMDVGYMWDSISFSFESEEQRQQLTEAGVLAPGDSAPFDADYDPYNNRTFIAIPHLLQGSAVTLATIENPEERINPRLLPYPNMSWHGGIMGCNGLTSVFRTQVDECGRLWVVDSGAHMQFGVMRPVCPPQLLVFNLTTDEVIAQHRFVLNTTGVAPLMITVFSEQIGENCNDDAYAYVADGTGGSLFVFHLQSRRQWQVTSDYFVADVNAHFSVAGKRFTKMIGVLGLALSPCLDAACDRYLFFHSFSGYLEGRVRTSILRNESLYAGVVNGARPYVRVIGQRYWPSVGQAMSRRGILFFGHVGEYSINCWNIHTPYEPMFIDMVEYDYEHIRIPMGVKIITNSDGEEVVWSLSNNAQNIFAFDFTPNNTYPIYLIRGKVNELMSSTACDL